MARFGTVSSSALDAYFAILQQGDAILVGLLMLCRHRAACSCCPLSTVLRLRPAVRSGSSASADPLGIPLLTLLFLLRVFCLQVPTSQTDCYRVVQPAAAVSAAAVSAGPVAPPQGPDAVMQAAMQQLTTGARAACTRYPAAKWGLPAAGQNEACSRGLWTALQSTAVLTLPARFLSAVPVLPALTAALLQSTMSVAGKRKPAGEAELAGDEITQQAGSQIYFPETQPSQNAALQQRKASMVQVGVSRRLCEGGAGHLQLCKALHPTLWHGSLQG